MIEFFKGLWAKIMHKKVAKPAPAKPDPVKSAPVKPARAKPARDPHLNWPTQARCDVFYGNPRGRGNKASATWEKQNLINFVPLWHMIDEDSHKTIKSFKVHRKCADSLARVFQAIWEHCDRDQAKIEAYKLHIFSGTYVFRPIRGARSLSMHAYGVAIDIASNENQMGHKWNPRTGIPQFAIDAFNAEGWTWGGNWSRPDSMHFQAARVR